MPSSTIYSLTVDCADPDRLARFWCETLGYRRHETELQAGEVQIRDPSGRGGDLLFVPVPEGKSVKNRLHLDLLPPSTMQAEVDRLRALGATPGSVHEEAGWRWTVMQDPEENEFCVCVRTDSDAVARP